MKLPTGLCLRLHAAHIHVRFLTTSTRSGFLWCDRCEAIR